MAKQLQPTTSSETARAESLKNPTSPSTGSTSPENWQEAWMAAAQKETPARRYLMEESLRRYQQMHPEDSGV